jgi:protease I
MSEQPAASPATNAGSTRPAGKGVDDEQLNEQVAEQTDSNLEVEGAFERESGGAATDTEAAKASGDELK